MIATFAEDRAVWRLVHVITDFNTGGAETAVRRLLESVPPPEFHCAVVVLGPDAALSGRGQTSWKCIMSGRTRDTSRPPTCLGCEVYCVVSAEQYPAPDVPRQIPGHGCLDRTSCAAHLEDVPVALFAGAGEPRHALRDSALRAVVATAGAN